MGSYKAYLDLGLDPSYKIRAQDIIPQAEKTNHLEWLDDDSLPVQSISSLPTPFNVSTPSNPNSNSSYAQGSQISQPRPLWILVKSLRSDDIEQPDTHTPESPPFGSQPRRTQKLWTKPPESSATPAPVSEIFDRRRRCMFGILDEKSEYSVIPEPVSPFEPQVPRPVNQWSQKRSSSMPSELEYPLFDPQTIQAEELTTVRRRQSSLAPASESSPVELQPPGIRSLMIGDHDLPQQRQLSPHRLSLGRQTRVSDFLPSVRSYPPKSSALINSLSQPSTNPSQIAAMHHHHDIILQPRGLLNSPGDDAPRWLDAVQLILQYRFSTPDILEEALESPGSGVTVVGESQRVIGLQGNARLARVGRRAMELVMWESWYLLRMGSKTGIKALEKALGVEGLVVVATRSKLERFVRRSGGLGTGRGEGRELVRDVTRGVEAVIGAVYLDGGMESMKTVMQTLQIVIPET